MKLLITADLHLTDRDRDAYRFGIFVWLVRRAEEHNVKNVFILGDLTEFKDRHSAALVNRMTYELAYLQRHRNVHILMGNHDFIDPAMPFFKFMNMKTDSRRLELVFGPCVMLPYQANQEAFDAHCGLIKEGDGVFCHQLFTGAVSETGALLSGINTTALEARKPKWVFAGDIHKPQTVGPVTYTGSPYQTRFGENYAPRVVLFDTETLELTDLYYPSPRKITLQITDVLQSETWGAKKGDHVKVILNLPPEEVTSWATKKAEIREVCKAQGLEVFGVELEVTSSPERISLKDPEAKTDEGIFESFCLANGIMAKTKDAGLALLKD